MVPNVALAILIPGYFYLSFFVKAVSILVVSFTLSHQLCSRDRDLAQISRRDRDFAIKAETETWKFETETRDLLFL